MQGIAAVASHDDVYQEVDDVADARALPMTLDQTAFLDNGAHGLVGLQVVADTLTAVG